MKIVLTWIAVLVTAGFAAAQENDTAVLRRAGVKYIEHHSYMAIYGERADTCLESKIWVNRYGLTSREIIDHNCQGWGVVQENEYTYDDQNKMVKLVSMQNDAIQSEAAFTYDEHGNVTRYEVMSFDPMTNLVSVNSYRYMKKGLIDSTFRETVYNLDTSYQIDAFSYNKNGKVSMVKVLNDTMGLIYSRQYIYDGNGNLTELNIEIMMPEYSYSKSIFTYNEEGQLFTSTNTDAGQTIQHYYNDKGLLILASHYNQFGDLVKNVHYKYTYY